jgi:putative ABC transport system substrate-binding protein
MFRRRQEIMMRRREFLTVIGGAATGAWPLRLSAQQPGKIYHVGFLANDPAIPNQPAGAAFLDGLRENGFVEGKNIIIERRFADGQVNKYADLVSELIGFNLDVIVTSSGDATKAAQSATNKIPIVMMNVADPVGQGMVASLARPGGNVTGLILDESAEIAGKRLQLLKDAVQQMARAAVLMNPDTVYEQWQWRFLQLAAPALNVTLSAVAVRKKEELQGAFTQITSQRLDALLVTSGGLNFTNRKLIMDLALKAKLPAMSSFRESTEAGGLISYGSNRTEAFRRAAIYVSKILKGANPGDLPLEQPTKYDLVINLGTAKALNLEIPRSLLLIADEVIE